MLCTKISPLGIILSSYNRQIASVRDIEQLFVFVTTGGDGSLSPKQVDAILSRFWEALFGYLNGSGHVLGTAPSFVTEEEYQLCMADQLFRAKTMLQQLTDSWLLPVGNNPGDKIKVQSTPLQHRHHRNPHLKVTLDLGSLIMRSGDQSQPMMNISTCSQTVDIRYTLWLHNSIVKKIDGGGHQFDLWIHLQMINQGGVRVMPANSLASLEV